MYKRLGYRIKDESSFEEKGEEKLLEHLVIHDYLLEEE